MLSEIRPPKVGKWTEPALRVLRERYLLRNEQGEVIETPEEMCWRVAQSIAAGEGRYGRSPAAVREVAEAFYDMMVDGFFIPNSPTLMNAGKGNGLQYSACYVLPIGDSMEEIFDSVKAAAIIHKSGGGCIAGDARVWTTFCGLEPIEVLFNRATADGRAGERSGAGIAFDVGDLDIRTVSMEPETGQTGLGRVTHVWRFDVPAELQMLVRTREGTEVQTSAWHPFMVVRPQGLVALRADELKPGDVILGPERPDDYWPYHEPRRVGSLVVDQTLGWLVGFTLGDGSFGYVPALRQYRLRWFSGERDVLERARSILAERGIHVGVQRDRRGLLSVSTLTQRFVLDMLEACGLEKIGAKDDRIRVPEIIAKSPLSVVRAFVAGLLDSDGYVAPDGSPSYATASREMAEDLAGLMSLLGYQPSVCPKPPHGRGRRTIYNVQLCTLPQVNDLRAEIAPHVASEHRGSRLHSAARKQRALQLPFRAWRDRLRDLGLVGAHGLSAGPCAAELSRWSCNVYGRCRRDDLSNIADAVELRDRELAGLLRRVAARGMEVLSVTRAAEPKVYYDLSVEGWNTYAAGTHGMAMVHNTGFAFSRLRPKDDLVASTGGRASGPVSFLRVFNSATEAVKQGGTRRGANMGILRVDHPDILEFIDCKLDGGITNFNISVAITDAFMDALARGEEYDLVNPHNRVVTGRLSAREVFERMVRAAWRTGDPGMVFIDRINASPANPTPEIGVVEATNPCVTGDTLVAVPGGWRRADAIMPRDEILTVKGPRPVERVEVNQRTPIFRVEFSDGGSLRVTAAHQFYVHRGDDGFVPVRLDCCRAGEEVHTLHADVPGTAKILRVEPAGVETTYDIYERETDTWITEGYVSRGCGEQPLLPNEACNLGSLNVSKFVRQGEDGEWTIDWDEMERVIRLAVRFLDDVIEMNPYPLPQIDETVKSNRRIGLGIMGWADLLFIMGIPYDGTDAIALAERLMSFVKDKSHDQCGKLAEERGPFPNWSCSIYREIRPMRNSTVTTIAPTGTISMIAGCSSGIEPIFALAFQHRVKNPDGERVLTFVNETFEQIAKARGLYSDALKEEIARRGSLHGIPGVPEEAARVFKTSHEIGFEWHVRHQAAFQRYTDNGVSKTINLPNEATEDDVAAAYRLAWELGCLGITVFRDGCKGEQVLHVGLKDKAEAAAAGPAVVKPRPHSLSGRTYRSQTPIGTAFITVNETGDGEPFEVFVQVGKGGSDTMAVAEALGRLISLTLRLPSPMSPQRRLEEVISQLSRIGGAQPLGFGKGKVLSLPDALARTLAEHTGQLKVVSEAPPGARAAEQRRIGDLCKECGQATFVYEEGCKKCLSCGYNEC
jgi:ribonucleoside-diphosphate reductase alpha chain